MEEKKPSHKRKTPATGTAHAEKESSKSRKDTKENQKQAWSALAESVKNNELVPMNMSHEFVHRLSMSIDLASIHAF
jgi:hypothetical protein